MLQEPTISSIDALLLFEPKILAAIDHIRNVNKWLTDIEAIHKDISITEASNINETAIVNINDELVKQKMVVSKKNHYRLWSFKRDLTNFPVTSNATFTGINTGTFTGGEGGSGGMGYGGGGEKWSISEGDYQFFPRLKVFSRIT